MTTHLTTHKLVPRRGTNTREVSLACGGPCGYAQRRCEVACVAMPCICCRAERPEPRFCSSLAWKHTQRFYKKQKQRQHTPARSLETMRESYLQVVAVSLGRLLPGRRLAPGGRRCSSVRIGAHSRETLAAECLVSPAPLPAPRLPSTL
jgi:hypothetical protein